MPRRSVGRALDGFAVGEEVFVATKCGRRNEPDGSIVSDLRPDSIRSECERSLRRLGVERLDLLQIHWPDLDSGTPLEESWSVLATLVDEGKVRWLGVSNFDVEQLDRCERIRHVDSLQPPLSILQQGALRTSIRWAVEHRTGVVAYSPMASGLLTGAFDRTRLATLPPDDVRLRKSEFSEPELSRNLALVERLRAIARDLGAGVAELAVAWALAQEGVTAAIVGARRPQQIEAWLGAAGLNPARGGSERDRRGGGRDRRRKRRSSGSSCQYGVGGSRRGLRVVTWNDGRGRERARSVLRG